MTQRRLDELDEQIVDIINGSGFIECDGGHGPGISISPEGKATVLPKDLFRRVAAVLGDPTDDLLPIASKTLPPGSVRVENGHAADPSGRRWRFVVGEGMWYAVNPHAVAR